MCQWKKRQFRFIQRTNPVKNLLCTRYTNLNWHFFHGWIWRVIPACAWWEWCHKTPMTNSDLKLPFRRSGWTTSILTWYLNLRPPYPVNKAYQLPPIQCCFIAVCVGINPLTAKIEIKGQTPCAELLVLCQQSTEGGGNFLTYPGMSTEQSRG